MIMKVFQKLSGEGFEMLILFIYSLVAWNDRFYEPCSETAKKGPVDGSATLPAVTNGSVNDIWHKKPVAHT